MLAMVMPSPRTPYWAHTSSAWMLAMPHSTALAVAAAAVAEAVVLGGSTLNDGDTEATSARVASASTRARLPPVTLIALVAQKLWYLTPAESSVPRTDRWLAAAVSFNAAATAVPRAFQSLMD